MRITGGKDGGFRYDPPHKTPARPTTDIAKEGLFNILNNRFDIEELTVLDLFGGVGGITYEFASRGAKQITTVELDNGNVQFINTICNRLSYNVNILKLDVVKYIKSCKVQYDMIFAGPPYAFVDLAKIPDWIIEHNLLNDGGWLILEHNPTHNFDKHPQLVMKRNYGTTIFSIFTTKSIEP